MNKFLSLTGKVALGVCLTLPMQTMANDADKLEAIIQVGDTIADMTVTQESINDVDKLMAEMPMPKTPAELMTFQSTAVFNVLGEYCQRHKPAVSQEMQEAVDDWTIAVNPKLNQSFSKYVNLDTPLNDKERAEISLMMRNMLVMMYLDTEQNTDPDEYCPALIQQLKTIDPDDFAYTVEKQYESYMQKSKQKMLKQNGVQ